MRCRHSFAVLSVLVLGAGCGGGGADGDGGGDSNPLVGSWFVQVTPVTSDNQTATIELAADLTMRVVHTQVNAPATSTPGCTETCISPGTYTFTATEVTMTPQSGAETSSLSGCDDPAQDGPTTPGSCTPLVGTRGYTISGTMLTLTDPASSDAPITLMRL